MSHGLRRGAGGATTLAGNASVLAQLPHSAWLEFTRATALLLLPVDAVLGLLLERTVSGRNLAVHRHGFLRIWWSRA
jgi:hypothetical protein